MSGQDVDWLKNRVQELEAQVADLMKKLATVNAEKINLNNQLLVYRDIENRRYRHDSDYISYGDDEYDR